MPRTRNGVSLKLALAALVFTLILPLACTEATVPSAPEPSAAGPSLDLTADDVDPTLRDDDAGGVAFLITDYADGVLTAVSGKGEQLMAVFYPTDPILPPNPIHPGDPIFPMLRLANLDKYSAGDVCRSAASAYNLALQALPGDVTFSFTSLIGCNARVWVVKQALPPNPIRAFRPVP